MRPEKVYVVEDLRDILNRSPYTIVVEYTKMEVTHFSELRKRLRGVSAKARVARNTFVNRAVKELGYEDISKSLNGQNAIVFGEGDVAAVAKVLKSFTAEFDKPTIKGGLLNGVALSPEQVLALASLPPREVLLAQLLGVLQAPASKLVRTLNEPGASLARLLQAKADKDAGGAAAPAEASTEAPAEAAAE
jgi:large subunit ribosomal protein L10